MSSLTGLRPSFFLTTLWLRSSLARPHTFASLLLQQGESPVYVKEQMGHSSIAITVDLYGHLIPGGNRQAVDRLDEPVIVRWDGVGSATPAQPGSHVESRDSANLLNCWCARQELNLRPTGSKTEIGNTYKPLIFVWSTAFF